MSDQAPTREMPVPVPDVMTPDEVASYLQVPVPTLYGWRTKGTGPLAIRVGKHLRYRRTDLDAWLEERATEQTSPRGAAKNGLGPSGVARQRPSGAPGGRHHGVAAARVHLQAEGR